MAFKLDISGHTTNQMMCALVYKKLKDLLVKAGKGEIFDFVISVKILPGKLIIKTQKPIVNSELKIMKGDIEEIFGNVLDNFGIPSKELSVIFR